MLSGNEQAPGGLSSLVVVPGAVPEAPEDPGSLEQALSKIHDPVPRPVGSDASVVLVNVFSRFLRHSMHEGGAEGGSGGGGNSARAETAPKRYSDSEAAGVGKGTKSAAGSGGPATKASAPGSMPRRAAHQSGVSPARQSIERAAAAAALGPAGAHCVDAPPIGWSLYVWRP